MVVVVVAVTGVVAMAVTKVPVVTMARTGAATMTMGCVVATVTGGDGEGINGNDD